MRTAMLIPAISAVMVVSTIAQFPSDVDIKKLPKDQIIDTFKHQEQILQDIAQQNIMLRGTIADSSKSQTLALVATGGALSKIVSLTTQIQELGEHDKKVTDELNAANKALWWYRLHWWGAWVSLGLGLLACIALAIFHFTGRLSLSAARVASKL